MVYYSSTGTNSEEVETKEVVASKYIEEGEKNTITEGAKTYTLHDYGAEKKMWANVRTEITGENGEKQETWWVWIPRYAYKINDAEKTIDVLYIGLDDKLLDPKLDEGSKKLPEGYIVHPAFETSDGNKLKGIWMSKYEPSYAPLIPSNKGIVPDMSGFNEENTYIELYNGTGFEEVPLKGTNLNTINNGNKWYNYSKKIWANIKTEIKAENGEKQESWWVWIPRYAYKIHDSGQDTGRAIDVIYIDTKNKPLDTEKFGTKLPEGYIVHPGFTTSDGKELKGIWMSKYEPSYAPLIPSNKGIVPDMSGFNEDNTYIELYEKTTNPDGTVTESFKDVQYKKEELNTINKDNKWYDYSKKIWANVKCTANNQETWWVWIPRYAYKIHDSGQDTGRTINVIYIDTENKPLDTEKFGTKLPEGYIVHPGFTTSDGKELKGIWMSKYEPSGSLDN